MINGSSKKASFSLGSLNLISKHLSDMKVDVKLINLREKNIGECIGCLKCLSDGECSIDDDMTEIVSLMKSADGFVVASPVRNGTISSLFKRFYERAIYTLGFPLELEGKYVMAVASVGFAGGKKNSEKFLLLKELSATPVDFIFVKTGMPPKKNPEEIEYSLIKSTNKLMKSIEEKKGTGLLSSIRMVLDRWVMKKFLLTKSPDVFAYVMKRYKEKRYM
jgi:multimeric flavodoxin WrbA